jgi:hypothetical protein
MAARWPRFTLQTLVVLVLASAVALAGARAFEPRRLHVLAVLMCAASCVLVICWYAIKAPADPQRFGGDGIHWAVLGGLLMLPFLTMDLHPLISRGLFGVLTGVVVMLLYAFTMK